MLQHKLNQDRILITTLIGILLLGTACSGSVTPPPLPATPPSVTSVSVSPTTATVEIGESQQFTATVQGIGNFDPSVRWFVNDVEGGNPSVGTISTTGLYRSPSALPSPNTVAVKATSVPDPGKNGTGNVGLIDIVSLEVSPADTVTRVGLTVDFTATATFTDGSARDLTNRVAWLSSAADIAAIDQLGLATPAKAGIAMISASYRTAQDQATLSVAELSVVVNPTDPLLLQIVTPTQEVVEYFGTRDAQGQVQTVDSFSVLQPEQGRSVIELDSNGRAELIAMPDGTVFKFFWKSATIVTVVGISSDGSEQVTLTVDPAQEPSLQAMKALGSSRDQAGPTRPRIYDSSPCTDEGRRRSGGAAEAAGKQQVEGQELASNSGVFVHHCGANVDSAITYLEYLPEDATIATLIPGTPAGDGFYLFSVPVPSPSDPLLGEPICTAVGIFADLLCAGASSGALDLVCLQIALTGIGAKLLPACLGASQILKLLCPLLEAAPPGTSLLELLCDELANLLNRPEGTTVLLRAQATIPGLGVFSSEPTTATVSGPFPDFVIDVGEELVVADFFTSPEDPDPFEGYVVTAVMRCAPPGTVVHLSIVGTDLYQDDTTCTVSGNQSCSLFVPGAFAGVVDTLTVTVGELQRVITIVF